MSSFLVENREAWWSISTKVERNRQPWIISDGHLTCIVLLFDTQSICWVNRTARNPIDFLVWIHCMIRQKVGASQLTPIAQPSHQFVFVWCECHIHPSLSVPKTWLTFSLPHSYPHAPTESSSTNKSTPAKGNGESSQQGNELEGKRLRKRHLDHHRRCGHRNHLLSFSPPLLRTWRPLMPRGFPRGVHHIKWEGWGGWTSRRSPVRSVVGSSSLTLV